MSTTTVTTKVAVPARHSDEAVARCGACDKVIKATLILDPDTGRVTGGFDWWHVGSGNESCDAPSVIA